MTTEPTGTPEAGQSRLDRGRRAFNEIYGPGAADVFLQRRSGLGADLARFGLEFNFGDVNSRPGLDLARREIATLAVLIGMGGADPQIAGHTKAALRVGLTPAEIVEVVIHCVQFVGFPRAINALAVVRAALADAGVDIDDPDPPAPPLPEGS
ncbi:carboxymuconolactone decarboxylase family protein [Micromonospora oryzae]|uniref:carboxymuconolactone decarboxylase family protein n=1 Tax=Micromonospora sp. DSM 102119 TaxID=3111768 RepID=UPI0031E13E5C